MPTTSFQKLISSDKPILIDFYADWCGPCKIVAPRLKELKKELGDKVRIIKIDVDKNQKISGELSIQSIPTLDLSQYSSISLEYVHPALSGILTNSAIFEPSGSTNFEF